MLFKLNIKTVLLVLALISNINTLTEWWENTKALELNTNNFFQYVSKDKPVVVKFYTKWCRYCKELAPAYDELVDYIEQSSKAGEVIIARIESNSNQQISMMYGVYSFPTIVYYNPNDKRPVSVYQGDRVLKGLWFWVYRNLPVKKRSERKSINKEMSNKIIIDSSATSSNKSNINNSLVKQEKELVQDNNVKYNNTMNSEVNVNTTYSKENNTHQRKTNNEKKIIINKMTNKLSTLEESLIDIESYLLKTKSEIYNQNESKKQVTRRIVYFIIFLMLFIISCFSYCVCKAFKNNKKHYHII